jgi:hypothetical protein
MILIVEFMTDLSSSLRYAYSIGISMCGILRPLVFSRNPKWCEYEITQLSYVSVTLRSGFTRRDNRDAKSKQPCVD